MKDCICQRGARTTCPVHGADVTALLSETEQRHRAAGYFDPADEVTALRDETERLRTSLATAERERDAAVRECERLRGLVAEACDKWAGYIEHRRGVLQHIDATCEDDADRAEAERGLQVLEHDVRDNLRLRSAAAAVREGE